MGSILSSFFGGPEGVEGGSSSSSSPSNVAAFHSEPRWQLHFNEVKDSNKLLVVDFTATWCGPCKFMAPAFDDMSTRFTDASFAKIDVDELSTVAQKFGVQAMPTFVLFKKGEEVDRVVGAKKDELEKKILKHRSSS